MTTDSAPTDELAEVRADVDDDAGPILGRRRNAPERASFTLATYDSRDREQLHKLTARTDIDASSLLGYLSPKISTAVRLGKIRDHLFRALVDDDGIGVREVVEVVVPDPGGRTDGADEAPSYAPVEQATEGWRGEDLRYRIGDQKLWESADAAAEHARVHGSSLRRFTAIMDDDTLIVAAEALEDLVDWFGRAASGERPTQPSKRSSGSRKSRARSGGT